jgi:hypothetical protein
VDLGVVASFDGWDSLGPVGESGGVSYVIWMMDCAESKGGLLLVAETHVRLTWLPRSVIADDVDGPIVLSAYSVLSCKKKSYGELRVCKFMLARL